MSENYLNNALLKTLMEIKTRINNYARQSALARFGKKVEELSEEELNEL